MVNYLKRLKGSTIADNDKAEGFGVTQGAYPATDCDFFALLDGCRRKEKSFNK